MNFDLNKLGIKNTKTVDIDVQIYRKYHPKYGNNVYRVDDELEKCLLVQNGWCYVGAGKIYHYVHPPQGHELESTIITLQVEVPTEDEAKRIAFKLHSKRKSKNTRFGFWMVNYFTTTVGGETTSTFILNMGSLWSYYVVWDKGDDNIPKCREYSRRIFKNTYNEKNLPFHPYQYALSVYQNWCKRLNQVPEEVDERISSVTMRKEYSLTYVLVRLRAKKRKRLIAVYQIRLSGSEKYEIERVYTKLEIIQFEQILRDAANLWKTRTQEYLKSCHEPSTSVIGAGISSLILNPRKRIPKYRNLISAPLVPELFVNEVIKYLEDKGIECYYEPGEMD